MKKNISNFILFLFLFITLFFTVFYKNNISNISFSYFSSPFIYISEKSKKAANFVLNLSKNNDEREKEYLILKKNYTSLEHKYYSLLYIENNFEKLKNYVSNGLTYEQKYLPCEIITAPKTTFDNTIIINRGLIDKIEIDFPLVYETSIIGRISKIYNHYAEAITLNNHKTKITGVFDKTGIKGIIQGTDGDILQALYVQDPEKKIKLDQIVYTSGDGLIYPPGYIIGKVTEIIRDSGLYVTIIIEPIIKIDEIDNCIVIFNSKNENFNSADFKSILKIERLKNENIEVLDRSIENIKNDLNKNENLTKKTKLKKAISQNKTADYLNQSNDLRINLNDLPEEKIQKEQNHFPENSINKTEKHLETSSELPAENIAIKIQDDFLKEDNSDIKDQSTSLSEDLNPSLDQSFEENYHYYV